MDSARPFATARLLVLVLAASATVACTSGNEPVKLTPAQAAAAHAEAVQADANARSGANPAADPHAGMGVNPHAGAMGGAMPGAAAGGMSALAPKSAGGLQFSVPGGWITQTPTSSMRKAQFQLPKEGDDPEDAQLVLFYFGGEGGTVEANLARWESEFEQPDGKSTKDVVQTTTRVVNGLNVTEIAISGTFVPSMMPGQTERVRREQWSMLGAIVESPSGPYFAKLTGPGATVSRWESSFRQWVSSMKHTDG